MRVIINLDPLRNIIQPEQLHHIAQNFPVTSFFSQMTQQRVAGISYRQLNQLAYLSTLRIPNLHMICGLNDIRFLRHNIHINPLRNRPRLIKLG